MKKEYAFIVNTPEEASEIILVSKRYKIKPILNIKNYLLRGFGSEFIVTFQNILFARFGKSSFKLYVDCGFDHGLGIDLTLKKIDCIKIKANSIIMSKMKDITKKNRVLLNPSFHVVDCRNIKNIHSKLKKLYKIYLEMK